MVKQGHIEILPGALCPQCNKPLDSDKHDLLSEHGSCHLSLGELERLGLIKLVIDKE